MTNSILLPYPSITDPDKRRAYLDAIERHYAPAIEADEKERREGIRIYTRRIRQRRASEEFDRLQRLESGRSLAEKRLRILDRHSPAGLKRIARQKYSRRAALLAQHHVRYSKQDLSDRLDAFGGRCAYCNTATTALTIDHFIPVSRGGGDCLGNFVPCCRRCNSSKNGHDPEIWYRSQPFYSAKRWDKILKLLGKNRKSVHQLPLL